jgi:iron complex transport system ATP-binding protein
MSEICLETHQLSIGYHARNPQPPVASGLNISLLTGELTCLIGPNGVGKSTLLRTLAGLQRPRGGKILVHGLPLTQLSDEQRSQKISIVLTGQAHPGDLRVSQVVGLGRLPYTNWLGKLSRQDEQVIFTALEQVNALHLAGRSFAELSDGERQKVMIARALAQETAVMILDEPTAFLDWPNRVDLLATLKNIARNTSKAILFSSHDLELILQVVDQLWLMGNAKPLSTGTCQELIDSGALEKIFASPYGQFDPAKKGFQITL